MSIRSIVVAVSLLATAGECVAAKAPAESLGQVFQRVDQAVVVIRTRERVVDRSHPGQVSLGGLGSGVLISADGKVVTAAHVVQTADAIEVAFADELSIKAHIVASDPAADLALLQLERVPPEAVPVPLGNSDKSAVGDEVFIVGAPFGISHTLTVGHLSARRQPNDTFGSMEMAELFQTDAAINQGNSGGPMFNMHGEVIGVVSHIVSRGGGFDGLGFVVTSNMARRLLLDEPSVWSGLDGYLLRGQMARAFNIPANASGLLIERIAENSPAQRFGLRGGSLSATIGEQELILGGDIIVAVEGIALGVPSAYENIRRRLGELSKSGGVIHIRVLRGGDEVELSGSIAR